MLKSLLRPVAFARPLLLCSPLLFATGCGAFDSPDIPTADEAGMVKQSYQQQQIVEGITVPWGMVFLPNGDMLVSERAGELRMVKNGQLLDEKISGLPEILVTGQGGLLDLELHPDYANNGWLYFSYATPAKDGNGGHTAIMRARLKGMALVDQQLLYRGGPDGSTGRHFGSRIEFDNAGYLYFSIGDRAERDINPQDLSRDGGKIYRLHDDGRIPEDNPFAGKADHKGAIYSYGHRNPQGMALNPVSGQIWTHEHGPRGGDEVNIINKGKNYGWPVISYGINYSGTKFTELTAKEGMEQPAWYWDPSIAPSGMTFITSDKYPQWQGKLIVGSLKFDYLVLLSLDGDKITEQHTLFEGIGRVRNVRQGPDGYLYVAVDGGGIKKIVPQNIQ